MQWACAGSTDIATETAVTTVLDRVADELGASSPDLVILHVSHHHRPAFARLRSLARARFDCEIVGCTAAAVIADGREHEDAPAAAAMAGVLPGVDVHTFDLSPQAIQRCIEDPSALPDSIGLAAGDPWTFTLFADPFSCDVAAAATAWDRAFGNATVIGGVASASPQPGGNALLTRSRVRGTGICGVALRGNIAVDTVLAQGCRPIGPPMFVTQCQGNRVGGLDGTSPTEVLQRLFDEAGAPERRAMRKGLLVGIAPPDADDTPDMLIRNVLGLDATQGLMGVGAPVEEGSVLQFHVRDASAAASELGSLMRAHADAAPAAAWMFSCLGRGKALYGKEDHDVSAIREHAGPIPTAGMFCGGEIAPIGRRTHVHGLTTAVALIRARLRH